MSRTYLSAKDIAEELGVGLSTAYRMIERMTHVRLGGVVRVHRRDFSVWREANGLPEPGRGPRRQGVYFVQHGDGGQIKIGHAQDIRGRLGHLQAGSPVRLTLLGFIETPEAAKLEAKLHKRFRLIRKTGEWFEPRAELLSYIDSEATKP